MTLYILFIFLLFQSESEIAKRLNPIVLEENIKLTGYDVSKSFKLNEDEYILIGKDEIQSIGDEGHRLIYISRQSNSERFVINYVSQPKGEAYVYNPYFYEFSNGEKFVVAEEGYEFMSGIDVFRYNNGQIKFLGHVSVSGQERNSVIDQLQLKQTESGNLITFYGQIEHPVSTDNIIDGTALNVEIRENGLTTTEK